LPRVSVRLMIERKRKLLLGVCFFLVFVGED
jgi:hypothetical protein